MKKTESTKEQLLTSAGELFAERGYEAISTRMIAEKAGVKLSAIHYHFGSKENLYNQACITAHARGRITTFSMVMKDNPALLETPEGQAEIIRTVIFRSFHDHFRTDRPEWETKILLKELVQPTSAMKILAAEIFKPDADSAMHFYKRVKPDATDEEAAAWSDMHYGQMILYKVARKTIEIVRDGMPLDDNFFRTAAAKLARALILEAGLPLPADLK